MGKEEGRVTSSRRRRCGRGRGRLMWFTTYGGRLKKKRRVTMTLDGMVDVERKKRREWSLGRKKIRKYSYLLDAAGEIGKESWSCREIEMRRKNLKKYIFCCICRFYISFDLDHITLTSS